MELDERSAAEWRRLCLARLRRFVRLTQAPVVVATPELRRLTRRAVFSAYRDCAAVGLEDEARLAIAETLAHAVR
jgi:hypothetical protein